MVRKEIADLSGLIADPHLYSTVHAALVDNMEGEVIEALYDNAGQYQEAISRSMATFHAEGYLGNDLMRYFKLPDDPKMEQSIKSKVESACVTVEASGAILYARLDLSMSADLTHDELDAFTDQIESQYRDGWGAEFELLTIPAGKEAVCLRLGHDDVTFFTAAEKNRFFQHNQTEQDGLKETPVHKPSIRGQLAAAKAAQAENPAAQQHQKDKGAR